MRTRDAQQIDLRLTGTAGSGHHVAGDDDRANRVFVIVLRLAQGSRTASVVPRCIAIEYAFRKRAGYAQIHIGDSPASPQLDSAASGS
jgi:hypothetical protein